MTDDTRALIDQTDDFRRRGMDGAVASNERVLAGRVPALLDAAEAGMRARRTALEDAKAALKDLWFGDEVARPGSLDAIEAIDALIVAAPTCNDSLQVQAARNAALEEAAQVADERAKEAREDEFCDRRELGDDYNPNSYGAGYNAGAHGSGVFIAREIRALRGPT